MKIICVVAKHEDWTGEAIRLAFSQAQAENICLELYNEDHPEHWHYADFEEMMEGEQGRYLIDFHTLEIESDFMISLPPGSAYTALTDDGYLIYEVSQELVTPIIHPLGLHEFQNKSKDELVQLVQEKENK